MAAKSILALCAAALMVQSISGQCIGNAYNGVADIGIGGWAGNGLAGCAGNGLYGYGAGYAGNKLTGYGAGYGAAGNCYGIATPVATGHGGALGVSSASLIPPNGVSVRSDNAIEGALAVTGQLPLLAAVAFEGELPTAGSAAVSYGCGNGNIGIVREGIAGAGLAGAAGYGTLGYGTGLAGTGLAGGCGYGTGLAGTGLAGGYGYGAGFAGRGCGCGGAYY